MKGILVDTSVWIDFFNGFKSKESDLLTEYIESDFPIYLCPIILQEILQGFKEDKDFIIAKDLLLEFPILEMNHIDSSIGAAELYRKLKKEGKSIRRSNDCLIAYYVICNNLPILHKDRDFKIISEKTSLKVIKV